jgi:1,4-dihydroxy-2-naphthoate octaprenyltransferase
MTKKQAWLEAFRLRTLPLSLAGIIVGSGYAYYTNHWDTTIFVFAMITTVLFQILSNLANDLGDSLKGTDNEQRVGPMRAVQSGQITKKQMKIAVTITSILSFSSAAILIKLGSKNLSNEFILFYFVLALLCILAAITYTIGKKAYGYLGLGDLMVLFFFGFVSVLGVYPLYAKSIDFILILPAFSIGLLSTAVLNLNNMRDIENDRASNKNTLVVKIGSKNAKTYHSLLIIAAFWSQFSFILLTEKLILLISLIPFVLLFFHLKTVRNNQEPRLLDPELKKVALSTFFMAILTFISFCL